MALIKCCFSEPIEIEMPEILESIVQKCTDQSCKYLTPGTTQKVKFYFSIHKHFKYFFINFLRFLSMKWNWKKKLFCGGGKSIFSCYWIFYERNSVDDFFSLIEKHESECAYFKMFVVFNIRILFGEWYIFNARWIKWSGNL